MFKIFDKLGGIEATLNVIHRRRGKRLGDHSIRSWIFYKKIPAINAMALMLECQARGIPFDMQDCVLRKPKAKPAKRRRASESAVA